MLNELYELSGALKHLSIAPERWHREYRQLPKATPKSPCFRIWIAEDGRVVKMDELEPELTATLRKYGNNQRSFPAFNIKPLYRVLDGNRQDNWRKSFVKIDNSLREISGELYEAVAAAAPVDGAGLVMTKLIEATRALCERGLRGELEAFLTDAIERGQTKLRDLLEFQGNSAKTPQEDMGANISVFLDFYDWENCGGLPAAHEETTRWLNGALNRRDAERSERSGADDMRDAFGAVLDSAAEPMPEVKLPGYTSVLRTMFRGQPCLERYSRFDDASYPISKENRASAKAALEFIANPEYEHITWVRAGENKLVFAYPSELPGRTNRYTAMLAARTVPEEQTVISFERAVEDFLQAFNAQPPKTQPRYIRIFSLERADKSSKRSKVVFTRTLTPERYIEAALQWRAGCGNIPDIQGAERQTPFPIRAADVLNTVWKQDGKPADTVQRIHFYQGIELLIDPLGPAALQYILRLFVRNAAGLVVYAGTAQPLSPYYAGKIAGTTALLGLLLYKLNSRKEDYMNEAAFLLGQVLKLCDELHVLYCQVERKGEIPPQLAGASMFATASDMPDKALALICRRMIPYLTWARTIQYRTVEPKHEVRKRTALKRRKQLEALAEPLREKLIDSVRLDDLAKAQLFLGYLAALPANTASAEGETENEQ